MLHRQSGLGRGLGALIPPKPVTHSSQGVALEAPLAQSAAPEPVHAPLADGTLCHIPLASVHANPHQPRRHFDHAAMEDLVSSIKEHGIIEPLVVTSLSGGRYELVAGERRLRASQIAGLATVPAVVRTATDQQKLELAIIENVQRQDLNPIEEAIAYKRLIEEFGLTQDQVSDKVGKSRPQVANTMRLLQLPEDVQHALVERKISASNARTLLSVPTDAARMELFRAMLAGNFTVRQTEARVPHPRRSTQKSSDPNVAEAERRLRERLGHRVDIVRAADGTGTIRIGFDNNEDLNSIISRFE
jgi:ParB family transcriptional regulator, chromosome partitioning protein